MPRNGGLKDMAKITFIGERNEEVTFSNVSNGCPFSLLQGNAWIRQTKSLGSLSNDDVDINEIGEKKQ